MSHSPASVQGARSQLQPFRLSRYGGRDFKLWGTYMLAAYSIENGRIVTSKDISAGEANGGHFWIDLCDPGADERARLEKATGIDIPTREEMVEIETSSRLYQENGTLFMTATLPYAGTVSAPEVTAVTFAVNTTQLITVRHGEPLSIGLFRQRLNKDPALGASPAHALLGLLDIIIDRIADLVEAAAIEVDNMSNMIFNEGISARKSGDYKNVIKKVGSAGILIAKVHESVATLTRLVYFLTQGAALAGLNKDQRSQLKALGRDLHSIREHSAALDNKLNFLLDATVGLVNLEQNQIIKIFSVVAVVFMPPTLIASVYGMNFSDMPELRWALGYEFSIILMLASAAATWGFFRIKKLL
ncbi:MAG: magnesium transporter CorA family protein [Pseudomonadota bacterium]